MKICIARLRSRVQYIEPLCHIVDSFFEVLRTFMPRNPQHQYTFYNCSFDGSRPVRSLDSLSQADVIIIPSEAEYTFHIPNFFHPMDKKRSDDAVNAAIPYIVGKKVIILRSDRADNEELYKKLLGPNIQYQEIDEDEFPANIHSLKYSFIKEKMPGQNNYDKVYDFAYWGSDKRKGTDGNLSGDQRHKILKDIRNRKDIDSLMIGRFYNMDRDIKMSQMKDIIQILSLSKYTLCFNWKSTTATTSRYIEALACGIVPLVWDSYDSNCKFGTAPWQRIYGVENVVARINRGCYLEDFDSVLNEYLQRKLTDTHYHSLFQQLLIEKLHA